MYAWHLIPVSRAAGSRFFDAISSDCMPVILSDSFMLSSPPFVDRLNYQMFTFNQGTKVIRCVRNVAICAICVVCEIFLFSRH